jgi:hypothetical protein
MSQKSNGHSIDRSAPTAVDWKGTARYEVTRLIERGGMGCVYEAFDREQRQRVALKTLLWYSPTSLLQFKQEFRTLAGVHHRNLVRLYELVAIDGDRVFFSMELVQGVDFLSHVRPQGASQADVDRLRPTLRQLVGGIQALHAKGTLHRDIKPSNVLVAADNRVVILDFGIATALPRMIDESLREEESLVGTARYMAPEQAGAREPTFASDWYSVGVLLYEALVGRALFEGDDSEVLKAKMNLAPPPPSASAGGVPDDLDALCLALLDRDPARRPTGPDILNRLKATVPSLPAPIRATGRSNSPQVDDEATPLIGREFQLSALQDAFDATRTGQAVTVCIHGHAGMGKSSLVRTFVDGLAKRGEALVLRGRAYERESIPYKAVDSAVDALSRHLMHLIADEGGLSLPQHLDALACLFPVLRRVPATSRLPEGLVVDPQLTRRRGFEALRELATALVERRPLVIAIDDVQWGDTDSVALLLDLIRPPHAPAILLLLAYRDDDAETAPFLTELRTHWPRHAEMRRVGVGPLELPEARQLSMALLGSNDSSTQSVADALARESGGSPFLIEELARPASLRLLAVPESRVTLEDVVGQRLGDLSESARKVVEMVAVGGRPLAVATLREAADVESIEDVITSLVDRRFARTALRGGHEVVELVHDRIRETIVAGLTVPDMRRHHAQLARALEAMPDADPEALATHLLGAGEKRSAGLYAELAAERAAAKLAFAQAVRLLRLALEISSPSTADGQRLRRRLGEMLEWAGFGADAAQVYLDVAKDAPTLQRAELERAAAEQLLTCGHIDDGATVLHRVLATAGLRTPKSSFAAIVWLLLYRAWIGAVGLRFKERHGDDLSRVDRLRLDALFAASLGFGVVDLILGACIQTRYMVMALRAGDRLHVLRAALLLSTQHANMGGPQRESERAVRELAQRLISPSDTNEMHAFMHGTRGVALFLRGHWAEALKVLDTAYTEYPNNRAGWHSNANLFTTYALVYLGQLRELAPRYKRMLREAEQRGDIYIVVNLRLSPGTSLSLAEDDPEGARRDAREAMALWSQRGYLVQHWQAMRTEAVVELYLGNGKRAYEIVCRDAGAIRKSFLLKGQFTRILMAELRGRCAIAWMETESSQRSRHLAEAGRLARALDSEGMAYAALFAAVLKAGVARARQDDAASVKWLHVAIRLADESRMVLHAASARAALGGLLNDAAGLALVQQAHEAMDAQGVRAPARLAAMLVPGFRMTPQRPGR